MSDVSRDDLAAFKSHVTSSIHLYDTPRVVIPVKIIGLCRLCLSSRDRVFFFVFFSGVFFFPSLDTSAHPPSSPSHHIWGPSNLPLPLSLVVGPWPLCLFFKNYFFMPRHRAKPYVLLPSRSRHKRVRSFSMSSVGSHHIGGSNTKSEHESDRDVTKHEHKRKKKGPRAPHSWKITPTPYPSQRPSSSTSFEEGCQVLVPVINLSSSLAEGYQLKVPGWSGLTADPPTGSYHPPVPKLILEGMCSGSHACSGNISRACEVLTHFGLYFYQPFSLVACEVCHTFIHPMQIHSQAPLPIVSHWPATTA
jgi:hypothetical protein